MKILTRYLLRAHLGPFLFAFAALTGVIWINTIARYMADLAGKGLPADVLLEFFLLSLPSNIALTIPMAVLVAVLYTFSQLTAENEITALKASGVDLRRLLLPLLVATAGIAAGMAWFNGRVLPEANHRWAQLIVDVGRKTPLLALREQTVNDIQGGDGRSHLYLRADRIDPASSRLQDVVIYDVSDPGLRRTIYADSGSMAFNPSRTDLFLTLWDGHLREVDFDEPEVFQRLAFREQLIRVPGVGNELELQEGEGGYRDDRGMTSGMLRERIDTLRADLAEERRAAAEVALTDLNRSLGEVPAEPEVGRDASPFDDLTAQSLPNAATVADELRGTNQRVENIRRDIRELEVEVHKKYAIAAAAMVFVLIGAPLAVRFPRGGVGMVIAISLVIFAINFTGLIGGETLADKGYVSPIWAMWGANAIMAAVGVVGILHMGREKGTGRGGGWSLSGFFGRLRGGAR